MSRPDRAVVFDLDGTLVDSLADIRRVMNEALTIEGFSPFCMEDYRRSVGEGVERLVALLLGPEAAPEALTRVAQNFRRIYPQQLLVHTRPYPGIETLLEALSARSVPLAVLSNKPDEETRSIVHQLFPGHFRAVVGQRSGRPRKPDPSPAFEVAAALDVDPGACFLVGDTPVDVHTALAAGMVPIGVSWGFRPVESLVALGAFPLRGPMELLYLVDAGPSQVARRSGGGGVMVGGHADPRFSEPPA